MSVLSIIDKQRLEDLFGMEDGYVLNFKDRTFAEFFRVEIGINIYDQRYAFNGTSKAKRLRAFWEVETASNVGRSLEKLLEIWRYLNEPGTNERAERQYEESVKLTARLLGRELQQETEGDFLKRDFGAISVQGLDLDPTMEQILASRLKEAIDCVSANAPLSGTIMCGSILEGLLLAMALKTPAGFNQAASSPKNKDTGKVKPFHEWSLANFIDVAHEVGLLRLDVKKFGHVLRDFRNYVHPFEQRASNFEPDEHTAQICLQVLKAAIVGLKKCRAKP